MAVLSMLWIVRWLIDEPRGLSLLHRVCVLHFTDERWELVGLFGQDLLDNIVFVVGTGCTLK